jgi:hypothetical protein
VARVIGDILNITSRSDSMGASMARFAGASAPAALCILAVLLAFGTSLGDTPIFVEGEEFVNYGGYNIGGADIQVEECSGASQGLAAGGLDVPGEWIELKVTFERAGCYDVHVFYQAEYGDTVRFELRLLDGSVPGGVSTVAYEAPGWGIG